MAESDALKGELVHVWGLNEFVAVAAKVERVLVIRDDEKDIRVRIRCLCEGEQGEGEKENEWDCLHDFFLALLWGRWAARPLGWVGS